jgi:hypothetical protein
LRFFILTPVIIFCSLSLIAQVRIQGTIKGIDGIINGVTITLSKKGETGISSYTIAASNGSYKIENNFFIDSVDINFSCIGFVSVKRRLANQNQVCDVLMEPQKITLPEITIDAKIPVIRRGDTINYNASEFTSKTDRVIGDIIKRLPGIEVEANGVIKYQGKPIRNYYIENLDLLGGKYNIANQNIPGDLVDQIQILENHQPIKAYDSSVTSELAAINIKLKPGAKNRFIVGGKAGTGAAPFLWDNELLGLNFRKGFQFISGYKGNNIGKAFSNEAADLIYDDKNKNFILERKQDLLQLVNSGQPPFNEEKYLFNKTHFFYSNSLFVLNNTAQLRCNISYSPAVINKTANNSTLVKFPVDSVIIIENQNQQLNSHKLSGELVYTVNKSKFFLKNTFKIENCRSKESGEMLGAENSDQKLSNPMFLITNNYNAIVTGKKNQFEINSNVLFKNINQELVIFPGAFNDFFNSSSAYLSLMQHANQKLFATDNSVTLRKNILKFNQIFAAGVFYQNATIVSALYKDTGSKVRLAASFQNDLHWEELRPYVEAGFTANKFFAVTGKTTVAYNIINRKDFILSKRLTDEGFLINNSVTVKKDLNRFFSVSLFLSNETRFGGINQSTTGFILYNYRSISKNSEALAKDKAYTGIFQINYRNPVHILFGYLSGGISVNRRNLVYEYVYYNQFSTQNAIETPNNQYSWFFNGSLSKFFKKSKTGLSLNGRYIITSYLQSLQGANSKMINRSFSTGFNFYNRKLNWLYPEISVNTVLLSNSANVLNGTSDFTPVFQMNPTAKLSFFPIKGITLTPSANFYYSNLNVQKKNQYIFLDFTAGFKKGRYDIELIAANLSGVKRFTNITSFDNFQAIQSYRLRPLNVLLYIRFRL